MFSTTLTTYVRSNSMVDTSLPFPTMLYQVDEEVFDSGIMADGREECSFVYSEDGTREDIMKDASIQENSICLMCNGRCTEMYVRCSACFGIVHKNCADLSEKCYEMAKETEIYEYFQFLCKCCKIVWNRFLNESKGNYGKVNSNYLSINNINELCSKVENLRQEMNTIQSGIIDKVQNSIQKLKIDLTNKFQYIKSAIAEYNNEITPDGEIKDNINPNSGTEREGEQCILANEKIIETVRNEVKAEMCNLNRKKMLFCIILRSLLRHLIKREIWMIET